MEQLPILVAFTVGVLLSGCYFGGLWLTVRYLPRAGHPVSLYLGSLIVRLAAIIMSLFAVLRFYGWQELVAGLLAFAMTRMILVRRLGVVPSTANACARERSLAGRDGQHESSVSRTAETIKSELPA